VDAPLAQGKQVRKEGFRASGAVGAAQEQGAVAVDVGDLRQGPFEDGDVVGGGVAPALPGRSIPAGASPV
jgi:hypothetical protein